MNPVPSQTGSELTAGRWLVRSAAMTGILVAASLVGLLYGSENITIEDLWNMYRNTLDDATKAVILWEVRLPRVIVAALVGGALGICGAVIQTLFRNPLADPYVLGLSSGAAVGAYGAIFIGLQFSLFGLTAISFMALFGGLAAVWVVYQAARVNGRLPTVTLILAGVVVNAMLSALILFLASVLETGRVMSVMIWLLGRIDRLNYSTLWLVAVYILVCVVFLIREARGLNALSMGEETAQTFGVSVESLKRRLLLITAFTTAVAVSISGLIGFIGIVVPHAARLLWGPDHRWVLPASFLMGGALLILADTVARVVLRPAELPVGVVTAIFGGPLFLILLKARRPDA